MADTTHKGYAGIQTALSTELNSLADNSNSSASAAIDNTTGLELFMDLELVVAAIGSARSASARVAVYRVGALDGTNYSDVNEVTAEQIGMFVLDASTSARRTDIVRDVPVPPGKFKLFVRNLTNQALASSGNTLKYNLHSVKSV
jgi:hypothetical protein